MTIFSQRKKVTVLRKIHSWSVTKYRRVCIHGRKSCGDFQLLFQDVAKKMNFQIQNLMEKTTTIHVSSNILPKLSISRHSECSSTWGRKYGQRGFPKPYGSFVESWVILLFGFGGVPPGSLRAIFRIRKPSWKTGFKVSWKKSANLIEPRRFTSQGRYESCLRDILIWNITNYTNAASLLVDDEALLPESLAYSLSSYEVTTAPAVDTAPSNNSTRHHIILLDLMMPEADGMEVCWRIRLFAHTDATAKVPQDMDKVQLRGRGRWLCDQTLFNTQELLARLKPLQLRHHAESA